jgi:hypothetical protein
MSDAVVHAHDPKSHQTFTASRPALCSLSNPASLPFAVTTCEASLRLLIQSNEQREGRGLRQGNAIYGPVFSSSGEMLDPGAGIRPAVSGIDCLHQPIGGPAAGHRTGHKLLRLSDPPPRVWMS